MTRSPDSKDAEKQYLGRTGGSAWEREKPFSPPGADTLQESLDALHDFAVAVQILQPLATDRVIDLGAGAGWCADLLQRLNRNAVAVDISLEMLRVARQRATRAPIAAAAGDLERLPFVDGAFDKAVCLNALHHVPDMAAAVHEVSRVLKPDGVAVFSEPGKGHSEVPTSVAAVRDFGVLEQEVRIEPFAAACRAAGFVEVRVCPISYAIPQFQLSLDEWFAWKRLARNKRPLRAAHKMWRAMLEFWGIGKQSVLFEEAFAMRLVRLFQEPIETHPFILAAKHRAGAGDRPNYRADIHVDSLNGGVPPGDRVAAAVTVRNVGQLTWYSAGTSRVPATQLGVQLLDTGGRVIQKDFVRAPLPADVATGQSASLTVDFERPGLRECQLKFDMVTEGVTWFEVTGSPTVARRVPGSS